MSLIINTIISITLSFSNGNVIKYEINEDIISQKVFIADGNNREDQKSFLEIKTCDNQYTFDFSSDSLISAKSLAKYRDLPQINVDDFEIEEHHISNSKLLSLRVGSFAGVYLVHYFLEIDGVSNFVKSNPNLFVILRSIYFYILVLV